MFSISISVGFAVACFVGPALGDGQYGKETTLERFYARLREDDGTGFYCDEGYLEGEKCLIGPIRDATNDCGDKEVQSGKCIEYEKVNESRGCNAKDADGYLLPNYCNVSNASAIAAQGLPCDYMYEEGADSCTLVTSPEPQFRCPYMTWKEGVTTTNKQGHCVRPQAVRPLGECTPPAENRGDGKCAVLKEEVNASMVCPDDFIEDTGNQCKHKNDPLNKTDLVAKCSSQAFRLNSETKKCKRWEVVAEKPSCLSEQGTSDGKGYCYSETTEDVDTECMGGTANAENTECSVSISPIKEDGCRDGFYTTQSGCEKEIKTPATFTCNKLERKITYPGLPYKTPKCITVSREETAKQN